MSVNVVSQVFTPLELLRLQLADLQTQHRVWCVLKEYDGDDAVLVIDLIIHGNDDDGKFWLRSRWVSFYTIVKTKY